MTKGTSIANADQIYVWDGTTYASYYMSNGKNSKGSDVDGLEGKWAQGGKFAPATKALSAGSAVWYYSQAYADEGSKSPYTISVAGQVLTGANCVLPISQGISFIANPFPGDLALNDGIPYVSGMTKGTSIANADQIYVWDGTTYASYYMSNGKNSKGSDVTGLEGKWAQGGKFSPTTDKILAGKGAWYYKYDANATFDITIASPIVSE